VPKRNSKGRKCREGQAPEIARAVCCSVAVMGRVVVERAGRDDGCRYRNKRTRSVNTDREASPPQMPARFRHHHHCRPSPRRWPRKRCENGPLRNGRRWAVLVVVVVVIAVMVVVVVRMVVVVVRRQGTGRKRRVGTDTPTRRQHSKQTHTFCRPESFPCPRRCGLFSLDESRSNPSSRATTSGCGRPTEPGKCCERPKRFRPELPRQGGGLNLSQPSPPGLVSNLPRHMYRYPPFSGYQDCACIFPLPRPAHEG
jgi:hypothetical protein